MKARTGAPNPKFAHTGAADLKFCITCNKRVWGLPIDKRYRNHGLPAPLCFSKFVSAALPRVTNFEEAGHRAPMWRAHIRVRGLSFAHFEIGTRAARERRYPQCGTVMKFVEIVC
jgi:hypothetical protein